MRQPGRMRRHAAPLAILLATAVGAARAQEEFDFRLIRPVVTLSAWGTPDADFQVPSDPRLYSGALIFSTVIAGSKGNLYPGSVGHDFVDDMIDPAPYFKATLRYAFGKSLVEELEARDGGGAGTRP